MWPVMDFPNRDAVELGDPRYWVLWYDPQFSTKERYKSRARIWNWEENMWDPIYQSPYPVFGVHISDANSFKVKFSHEYEENRNFDVEMSMVLEEWEHLMNESGKEGVKYVAAQDPDNMPFPIIPTNWSWGVSGKGKLREMYVDKWGYLWENEAETRSGKKPIEHVTDNAPDALRERLKRLWPISPDMHPARR